MYWGDAPIGLIWAAWGGTRVEVRATGGRGEVRANTSARLVQQLGTVFTNQPTARSGLGLAVLQAGMPVRRQRTRVLG